MFSFAQYINYFPHSMVMSELDTWLILEASICSGVTRKGRGRADRPGDTLQGSDTRTKKIVGEFTKNS